MQDRGGNIFLFFTLSVLFFLNLASPVYGQVFAFGPEKFSRVFSPPKPQSYSQLPPSFEANHGQVEGSVKYLARGPGYTLYFRPDEIVLALLGTEPGTDSPRGAMPRLRFVNANPHAELQGLELLPGKVHYLTGQDVQAWHRNIPTYAKVRYRNVYPGVDVIFYARQQLLEYDIVLAPGVDPGQVQLVVEGVDTLTLDGQGDLVLQTAVGLLTQRRPQVYQRIGGERRAVASRYRLASDNRVGFQLAAYDPAQPVVIDPVLDYSSYWGGQKKEAGLAVAVDAADNIYLTGMTQSLDLPMAAPWQGFLADKRDAFVAKLDPTGTMLLYATYFGGAKDDEGHGLAVTGEGEVFVTGVTASADFPTAAAWQATLGGKDDAFVAKFSADGSALDYATYLGGEKKDRAQGIALDAESNAYVTGTAKSSDFPTTEGAWQAELGGHEDAFVAKLDASGGVTFVTYLGGKDKDEGYAIAIDGTGSAWVAGSTQSKHDFPLFAPLQSEYGGGGSDAFVAKLSANGTTLQYSTYLGGKDKDAAYAVAADSAGNALVAGSTKSKHDFPLINPWQPSYGGGGNDAFVAKLSADGLAFQYVTYLGGKHKDEARALAVDKDDAVHIVGVTDSKQDFPTVNPVQPEYGGGGSDAFVAKLKSDGSELVFASYLGGKKDDEGYGVAANASSDVIIVGYTKSKEDFPLANPLQPFFGGDQDAFLARLHYEPPSLEFLNPDDGATLDDPAPTFDIAFAPGEAELDLDSFRLIINGDDVTSVTTVTPTGATYSPLAALPDGENDATATIADHTGLTQSITISFTVIVSGFRSLPEAAPTSGPVPLTVRFESRAAYPDGAILRYRWDFQGDGIFDTSDPGERNYTYTYTSKGIYNAVLEVLNDKNEIATASVTITVAGNPPIATASVDPSNGEVPLTVNFTGSGSDNDGQIVLFEWDFEGDGIFDFSSAITGNTTHTYNLGGTYDAVFRVTDNDGLTAVARVTTTAVRVGPPGSPTATISAPGSPINCSAPCFVSFNGFGSDSDGAIVQYEWDFEGDGVFDFASATSAATSFTYNSPGIFTAALRVTDDDGLTGIDTVDVNVSITTTLSLSTDTCGKPVGGDAVDVITTIGGTASVTIFVKDRAGERRRTLVNQVPRTADSYTDTWDCTDDSGLFVPEGVYFAVMQYEDANGVIQTVDESQTTGGQLFNPNWIMEGSTCFSCFYPFAPLENDFLDVDMTLSQAAEVTVSIRVFRLADEVVRLMDRKPLGRGLHRLKWDGSDALGNFAHPPPGRQFIFGVTAFTLPNNGVFVEGAPRVTNFSVDPNYFDPATPGFITPDDPTTTITFDVSKDSTVMLQVFRSGSNILMRTISKDVNAGTQTVEWDGRDNAGIFVDSGDYRLALKAVDAQGNQSLVRYLRVRVFY